MIRLFSQYFTCPTWHRPLFAIVPDGIEIKCKACGLNHFIGRSHLEEEWNNLSGAETQEQQEQDAVKATHIEPYHGPEEKQRERELAASDRRHYLKFLLEP